MAIGDPDTHPEVDTVFIPNSFNLEWDVRDWEGCTLVPWATHLPRGTGAQDFEALLLDKLQLRRGTITVTINQLEPFLFWFEHNDKCDKARRQGRFQGNDIDICLRCWCSLTHVLSIRIFYRVRLYLDDIPDHAWTPDIIERTANPSEIPKRVWLVFTHKPSYKSTPVFVTKELPKRWQQGIRYEIFLQIGLVEDYSTTAHDLPSAAANPAAFAPIRRPYVWHYNIIDGALADTRSRFPTRLPKPICPPPQEGRPRLGACVRQRARQKASNRRAGA
uniref:DUF4283 domain-containing protein n=1 Tax=Setaria viridis TaxID=4556 RepID=A0A4U6V9Y2_SETVI|nr:hypothetical protein SEVIR_3G166400v2 [Setaria viridis]